MCEECALYCYDEEFEEYYCSADMDEDDVYRLNAFAKAQCPYFRGGDEYEIVRKQN